MRVQTLDLARTDLVEGFFFYERQKPGVGDYFLTSLYADIESLKIFGGIHQKAYKGYHRLLSKRFPFAVFYTVEEGVVSIRAVVDCRKHPSWIRKHLKQPR